MNEAPSPENAPQFTGRPAAFYLGSALLLAVFLVLVFAWRDNGQRKVLETTAEFTAVGDAYYFPMPPVPAAPVEPFPAVAAFHGQPLDLADYRKHTFQPDDMIRVGVTDQGGYIIYRAPKREKDADERKRGEVYYLKLSPMEYLKTRVLKAGQEGQESK